MNWMNFFTKGLLTGLLTTVLSLFMVGGAFNPRQAAAAVAFDAASESDTGTTGSTNAASFTWTHAGSASTKGVVVFVYTLSATDLISSVTYGGTTMTRVTGGAAIDNAGEAGRVDTFFLGASVPAGTRDVVVNRTNNATVMYAVAMTVTAASDTGTTGIVLLQQDGAYAVQSVNDGSPGANSLRFAGGYTGATTPVPAGTGSTLRASIDLGSSGASAVQETVAGQGARNVGFTYGTSDDRAAVHLAVREVPDITPPAVSSIIRANTSPTNATSVQYTVTFSESVTGVNASDFTLTASGVTGASVTGVSGSGSAYTVTVGTGSGTGTLRLDLTDDDTIVDGAANPLGGTGLGNGSFTTGAVYVLDKTAPTATIDSISPDPTNSGTTVTWHADENGTYDVRVGGTSCVTGTSVASGSYTTQPNTVATAIAAGSLAEGANSVRVCVSDAVSNLGSASSSVNKDTTAPSLTPVSIASNNADPTKAVAGNIITVAFTSSESITTPTVTIAGNTASVSGGPTVWSATYTVLVADPLGIVPFSISAFNDLVGNAGSTVTAVTDASSVTVTEANAALTVTTAGAGGGTVISNPGNISCNRDNSVETGTCSDSTFANPTDVTLTAAPDWKSVVAWTGGCINTGNSCGPFTLNGNIGVTATFTHKQQVMMPGPVYYASIQDAYNAVTGPEVFKLRNLTFTENLVFAMAMDVTLDGGCDETWTPVVDGMTGVSGSVTIAAGSVTVNNLSII